MNFDHRYFPACGEGADGWEQEVKDRAKKFRELQTWDGWMEYKEDKYIYLAPKCSYTPKASEYEKGVMFTLEDFNKQEVKVTFQSKGRVRRIISEDGILWLDVKLGHILCSCAPKNGRWKSWRIENENGVMVRHHNYPIQNFYYDAPPLREVLEKMGFKLCTATGYYTCDQKTLYVYLKHPLFSFEIPLGIVKQSGSIKGWALPVIAEWLPEKVRATWIMNRDHYIRIKR